MFKGGDFAPGGGNDAAPFQTDFPLGAGGRCPCEGGNCDCGPLAQLLCQPGFFGPIPSPGPNTTYCLCSTTIGVMLCSVPQ